MSIRSPFRHFCAVHGIWAGGSLLTLAILLPLAPALLPALILLSTIFLLFKYRPLKFHPANEPTARLFLFGISAFFIWHVIAILWSSNLSHGFFDLEIKFSLILFPVLYFLIPPAARKSGAALLAAFVIGNILAVLICLLAAAWRIGSGAEVHWGQELMSSQFSLFLHPSYAAMYLCLSISILFFHGHGFFKARYVYRTGMAILLTGILLMASKLGWIAIGLLFVQILIVKITEKRSVVEAISGLLLMALGIGALNTFSIHAADRINELREVVTEQQHDVATTTSSRLRWLIWDAASNVIGEHWIFGTGTGDVKDELVKEYDERGYIHAYEQRLNAHSQILQTAAALGVIGALILLALILLPAIFALREGDHLMLAFLGLNLLNWIVESMLEVQAGVLFLSFIGFALLMRSDPQREK